jgi:aspartyl protease family protein
MKHLRTLLLTFALGAGVALALPPLKPPHVNMIGLIGERAILRIDGDQVVLKPGESRGDVTLLRVESGKAVLRVGGREMRLGLGMDTGGVAARDGKGASIEVVMNGQGQYITSGSINGRVVQFLVDTGANTVSMTSSEARRLGIDYLVEGTQGASMTAGGVVRAWGVTLKSVTVGPITLQGVQATVRESNDSAPILLGMTFLSRVSLQQENNRMRMSVR